MGDLFEDIGRSAGRRSSASNASVISGSSTGRLRRHSRRENWFYQQQHQHDIVEEKSDRKRSTKSKRKRSSKVAVFHESSHHEKSDRKMRTRSKRERSRKVASSTRVPITIRPFLIAFWDCCKKMAIRMSKQCRRKPDALVRNHRKSLLLFRRN